MHLSLLSLRLSHGLSFSSHSSYRSYLSRRLRRLRRRHALTNRAPGARDRGYARADPAAADPEGRLQVLLAEAERAWAAAGEIRAGAGAGPGEARRKALLGRVRKAAKHAAEVAALAKELGDAKLESEGKAYSLSFSAALLLEQGDFAGALPAYESASSLLLSLAASPSVPAPEREAAATFRAELEPQARFC
ncbi:hypothetical protein TeGR_g8515, partial [Tetraparma gracilis]